MIFGREPAVAVETAVAVVLGILVIAVPDHTVLGYANAAVVAIGGFATAALVSTERALPALVGVVKAVVALLIGLGVPLQPTWETGIIMVISAVGTLYVRQNVVAPVPASVRATPFPD